MSSGAYSPPSRHGRGGAVRLLALYLAPGDPAAVIAGDQATPRMVERIRASSRLDRPYLVPVRAWVWDILQRRPGVLDLHQPAGQHDDRPAIEPDAVR
jgi:hypothetical protein